MKINMFTSVLFLVQLLVISCGGGGGGSSETSTPVETEAEETTSELEDTTASVDKVSVEQTVSTPEVAELSDLPSAPVWSLTVPDQSVEAGDVLILSFIATDSDDGDVVSYAITENSMTCDDGSWNPAPYINSSTGTLVGRPMSGDVGSCTIRVIAKSGDDKISQTITVSVESSSEPVSSVSLLAPSAAVVDVCTKLTAQSLDSSGVPSAVLADELITMVVNNGSGSFYSDSGCTSSSSTTTILTGNYEADIYFKSSTAPQSLTLIANSVNYTNGFASMNVGSLPVSLLVESDPQIISSTCEKMRFQE